MAYIHSSGGEPIPPAHLAVLAQIAGLSIPEDDVGPLSTALRDQIDSLRRIEELDLSGVAPSVQFDARWHD